MYNIITETRCIDVIMTQSNNYVFKTNVCVYLRLFIAPRAFDEISQTIFDLLRVHKIIFFFLRYDQTFGIRIRLV